MFQFYSGSKLNTARNYAKQFSKNLRSHTSSALKLAALVALLSTSAMAASVAITEGFESGVVPPTGWLAQNQTVPVSAATWSASTDSATEGTYSAHVAYPGNANPVDTWLLSPAFTLDNTGVVSFKTHVNLAYCVVQNRCSLEVWAVVGATAGDVDDIRLKSLDDDWAKILNSYVITAGVNFINTAHFVQIPADLGEVRIGFRYVSTDGAAVYLDEIQIHDDSHIVNYVATVNTQSEVISPVTGVVSTTATFSYNFTTKTLWSHFELSNPTGFKIFTMQLYHGTAIQDGQATHDYKIPITTKPNVTLGYLLTLTDVQEGYLVNNALFVRPYVGNLPEFFGSGGRGHLVQALPIEMGFQANIMPPNGWAVQDGVDTEISWMTSVTAFEGAVSAAVFYPGNVNPVDTWLLSPAFIPKENNVLKFANRGSAFWCVTSDNCDLEVWVVRGEIAGDGDDTLIDTTDSTWSGEQIWGLRELSFPSNKSPIRIGFRVAAADGDSIRIDSIEIDGEDSTCYVVKAANDKAVSFCL